MCLPSQHPYAHRNIHSLHSFARQLSLRRCHRRSRMTIAAHACSTPSNRNRNRSQPGMTPQQRLPLRLSLGEHDCSKSSNCLVCSLRSHSVNDLILLCRTHGARQSSQSAPRAATSSASASQRAVCNGIPAETAEFAATTAWSRERETIDNWRWNIASRTRATRASSRVLCDCARCSRYLAFVCATATAAATSSAANARTVGCNSWRSCSSCTFACKRSAGESARH